MAGREKNAVRLEYKSWNVSRTKKLFRWNKKILFIVFEGLSFGLKLKFYKNLYVL